MRVISGKARGCKLETIEKDSTRPTLDRVKESLFNIIQFDINGKRVLDLFAGSGALGIEALSRGASEAYFCDANRDAINIIKKNLEKTRFEDQSKLYKGDYKEFLNKYKDIDFDIIFIDPPYFLGETKEILEIILKNNILADNGIIVIETDELNRDLNDIDNIDSINLKKSVNVYDIRKYGRVNLIFVKEEIN